MPDFDSLEDINWCLTIRATFARVDSAKARPFIYLNITLNTDAAQMMVASVDTDRFTPKMTQVAVQSALASSDPLGLCPLTDGMQKADSRVLPLVQAICSGLNGEPDSAAAQIESARRRGTIGGIDLALAQKVAGATADGIRRNAGDALLVGAVDVAENERPA